MNLVVLIGTLSRPAETRSLPSGTRLVSLEVTTRSGDARAETVPVAWFDAPASAATLDAGTEVVVLGRVRRRFFRTSAGPTGSRTEVFAERVVPAGQARRVERLWSEARARLDDPGLEPAVP